jgi:hypothetical protein
VREITGRPPRTLIRDEVIARERGSCQHMNDASLQVLT